MLKKGLILFAGLFLLTFESNAICFPNACEGNNAVTLLYPTPGGTIILRSSDPGTNYNNLDCNLVDEGIALRRTHPAFNETYANLLTSIATDKPMRIRVATGDIPCEVAYAWISK